MYTIYNLNPFCINIRCIRFNLVDSREDLYTKLATNRKPKGKPPKAEKVTIMKEKEPRLEQEPSLQSSRQNLVQEAKRNFNEALTLKQKSLGKNHALTAMTREHLAHLLVKSIIWQYFLPTVDCLVMPKQPRYMH